MESVQIIVHFCIVYSDSDTSLDVPTESAHMCIVKVTYLLIYRWKVCKSL